MIWWLIPLAYMGIGCFLVPRFARAEYRAQHARWKNIQTKETSLREGVAIGWGKSLLWPVFLIIHIAVEIITAEERAVENEAQKAKTIEGAKAIIKRYEAEERARWSDEYLKGSSK